MFRQFKQWKQLKQCKQCKLCKQFIARCYLLLWWYFYCCCQYCPFSFSPHRKARSSKGCYKTAFATSISCLHFKSRLRNKIATFTCDPSKLFWLSLVFDPGQRRSWPREMDERAAAGQRGTLSGQRDASIYLARDLLWQTWFKRKLVSANWYIHLIWDAPIDLDCWHLCRILFS